MIIADINNMRFFNTSLQEVFHQGVIDPTENAILL